MKFALLSLCALTGVLAAPHTKRNGYAVKDSHPVPQAWRQLSRAPAGHRINLRIGLKQKSFAELERHLYEISDPDHPRYGQHLSHHEVNGLVAPGDDALDLVHSWLGENKVDMGGVSYSPAKDWIIVAMPVEQVEDLLDTEYHVYENDDGDRVVRTPGYSLPLALHHHVDVVQPTNYFGNPRALSRPFRLSSAQPHSNSNANTHSDSLAAISASKAEDLAETSVASVCNETSVTNKCLRTLYGTIDYVPQVPMKNSVAMTAYLNETANITDFHTFLSTQRKDANLTYTYNYTTIAGGRNNQTHVSMANFGKLDVEANLDSQTIGGFVYPTNFRVYSTGTEPPFKADQSEKTDENEPYLAWLQYMLKLENPPHTVSTSYGDDEQTVPLSYATRVCQDMAQLGAKGVTLFFSSGDDGVGVNGTCHSNDGKNKRMFIPEFPTSCPYVTSVGGTRNFSPEIVAFDTGNGYVSGSGISNYFARPSYQSSAVSSYLSSIGDLHSGLYNTTGRAYPDIAAQGFSYVVTYAGININVDGTSAAAPCATSVLTLINDALIAAGKAPLGFLNPALYKTLHGGFTDVTQGSTWGCSTSGFPAKKGWDLASGWGTPNFAKIRQLAVGTGNSTSVKKSRA